MKRGSNNTGESWRDEDEDDDADDDDDDDILGDNRDTAAI